MDGRIITLLLTFLLPAVLIAVTVWQFASNPISILVLLMVMIAGALYLLTYTETFGGPASS
jgi:predicted branched-subunit amino acid permease